MNNAKTLIVKAHIRYWEDSKFNDEYDTEDGDNAPCKVGDLWCPEINVVTGVISNWDQGKTANIHYKVSDECGYELLDCNGNIISSCEDGYVPDTLCPADNGYGDYIIMNIDENGKIEGWHFNIDDFSSEDAE